MLSAAKHLQYLIENKPMQILRFALSKIKLLRSFPRRRESSSFATGQDPRLREVTIMAIFIALGVPETHDLSG